MNTKTLIAMIACMFVAACSSNNASVIAVDISCATCPEFFIDPNGTMPCFYSNDLVVDLAQCLCTTDCATACANSSVCTVGGAYDKDCVECMFAESKCGPAFDACMQD